MARYGTNSIGAGPVQDPYGDLRSLFAVEHREPLSRVITVGLASVVLGLVLGTLVVSRAVPLVAGWKVTAVAGGSMGPAINTGDLIAYRAVDPNDIQAGQIVVFENPARAGESTVHRVVARTEDGGFVTKGDANETDDSTPVAAGEIQGVATMLSPFAGYPSLWIANRDLVPLAIFLASLAIATAAAIPTEKRPSWVKVRAAHGHTPVLEIAPRQEDISPETPALAEAA